MAVTKTSSLVFVSLFSLLSILHTQAQAHPFSERLRSGSKGGDHVSHHPLSRPEDQPSPVSRYTGLSSSIGSLAEGSARLSLRDSLLSLLESPVFSSALDLDFLIHDDKKDLDSSFRRRQSANDDLQSKLTELESAMEGLIEVLEQQYGVQMAPATSIAPGMVSSTSVTGGFATSNVQAPSGPVSSSTSGSSGGPGPGTVVQVPLPSAASSTSFASSQSLTFSPTALSTASGSLPPSSLSTSVANTPAYVFDPNSRANTAVYYSQTAITDSTSLLDVCQDPNIDIVILAFLNRLTNPPSSSTVSNNSTGMGNSTNLANTVGYPTLNLGPNCWAASAAQVAAGANTLLDCVSDGFAEQISQCQDTYGKKVMLSLGGAHGYSDTTLTSDEAASSVAEMVWDLFLGGGNDSGMQAIRPFGNVVLDGIDIDNESGSTLYMDTLMSTLRELFTSDQSRTYYLSAAPQCPRPDASIPLSSMQTQTDFVWVQFYNNPQCNLNSGGGFISSLQAWSSDLQAAQASFVNIGNGVSAPRLFIGAPAFAGAGSGFVSNGEELRSILEEVQVLNLTNLAGMMWWDGSYELQSGDFDDDGETFAQIMKDVFG